MTTYLPVVIMFAVVIGGWLIWMMFFQKKFAAKATAATGAAKQMFDENRESLIEGYMTDKQKYGILKDAVGDEKILGIASYVEPKSIGKTLTAGIKTQITNVKKINMDLFYMVVTDKNLHCIESNGKNSVDHVVMDLGEIKEGQCGKASPFNVKNAVTGVSGDLLALKFNYKGEKHSYNLYKMIYGYPYFTVTKNFHDNGFEHGFPGREGSPAKITDQAGQLEWMINSHLYEEFKRVMNEKTGITF